MGAALGVPISKDKINLGEAAPLKAPFLIFVEPSTFCNLKCKFCPNTIIETSKKSYMTMTVFKKIIDDIRKFPSEPKVFKFCGIGEPLMHKNIGEMIKFVNENISTQRTIMYTNGVLLNPELNREIVLAGLNQMNISVEALDDEGYMEFAQTKVDFNKFVANIKDLYEHKEQLKLYIKIHHMAIKNEEEKQRFFNIFGNICDFISIEGISHIFPDFISEGEHTDIDRYDDDCEAKHRQICAISFKTININADGSCSPCSVDWAHRVIIGNINEKSLLDIWNDIPLRELQKRFCSGTISKEEACYDCADYYLSGHEDMDKYADEILKRLIEKDNKKNF